MNTSTSLANSAIKVESLSFFYGSKKALEGVSLQIPQKQVTAMIGPLWLW